MRLSQSLRERGRQHVEPAFERRAFGWRFEERRHHDAPVGESRGEHVRCWGRGVLERKNANVAGPELATNQRTEARIEGLRRLGRHPFEPLDTTSAFGVPVAPSVADTHERIECMSANALVQALHRAREGLLATAHAVTGPHFATGVVRAIVEVTCDGAWHAAGSARPST
jgi:hypothetical protein